MADLNNQQFYEVDSGDSSLESPQKRNFKKPILIGGAIVLVIVAIILAVIFIGGDGDQPIQELKESIAEEMSNGLRACEGEFNQELCKNRLSGKMALEHGDVSLCSDLEGSWKNDCVLAVAFENLNETFCKALKDDDFLNCRNKTLTLKAIDSDSVDVCFQIESEVEKDKCVDLLGGNVFSEEDCLNEGGDPKSCADAQLLMDIFESNSPTECNSLEDEVMQNTCITHFVMRDSDGDGINDYDEIVFGSGLLVSAVDCEASGLGAESCQLALDFEAAASVSDPTGCVNLTSQNAVELCKSGFEDRDSDLDGLSDADEVLRFGTDRFNSDTDGDGFSDGDEVLNGFDPLN